MKIIKDKHCIIGEGPIWNEKEQVVYFTNGGGGNEICMLDVYTGAVVVRPLNFNVAAMTFDKTGRLIVSCKEGVFYLNEDGTTCALYDTDKYRISNANDMKAGPDGSIYVGTQSSRRLRISDEVDGKLYRIDSDGTVEILLDGLLLSNGMAWSTDEKLFYHTDSDTKIIKEYFYDKEKGSIIATGREIFVKGVDGFTIDNHDQIWAACWGQGHVAKIDCTSLEITDYLELPMKIPASCEFAGKELEKLVVVSASKGADMMQDQYAGCAVICDVDACGRLPYVFGK